MNQIQTRDASSSSAHSLSTRAAIVQCEHHYNHHPSPSSNNDLSCPTGRTRGAHRSPSALCTTAVNNRPERQNGVAQRPSWIGIQIINFLFPVRKARLLDPAPPTPRARPRQPHLVCAAQRRSLCRSHTPPPLLLKCSGILKRPLRRSGLLQRSGSWDVHRRMHVGLLACNTAGARHAARRSAKIGRQAPPPAAYD